MRAYEVRNKEDYPDENLLDHGDVIQSWLERWELGHFKGTPLMPKNDGKAADTWPMEEGIFERWRHARGVHACRTLHALQTQALVASATGMQTLTMHAQTACRPCVFLWLAS